MYAYSILDLCARDAIYELGGGAAASSVRAASKLSHRYLASSVVNVMGGLYFRTLQSIPSVVIIILNFFNKLHSRKCVLRRTLKIHVPDCV